MKRRDVIQRLKKEAKRRGLAFGIEELTNHTGIWVGECRSTLGQHTEIPDVAAHSFWDQFAVELGKGWWR